MEASGESGYNINSVFDNCVIWHQLNGMFSKPAQQAVVKHCSIGDLRTANEMGLSSAQASAAYFIPAGTGIGTHGSGVVAENNIITGAYTYGLSGITSSNRDVFWGNGQNYAGVGSITGDITNVNPFINSLKYLPRIEAGSALSGKASDGGDIGANIIKKIGVSGALYGEPGYDQLTDENLWPWPNEDWIKTEMGNYNRGGLILVCREEIVVLLFMFLPLTHPTP